jgi:hypothetical protein
MVKIIPCVKIPCGLTAGFFIYDHDGRTIAVLTLAPTDIRLMSNKEILHVREFADHLV